MASAWALIENKGQLLFIRRALDVGRGGQWCPPGGTMWRDEWPEVACVREAYEETGLRVTVSRPVAKFESAWYFLCSLNNGRDAISLREQECIDACWVMPNEILGLGTVMDLRRIIPLLELSGFRPPSLPTGLEPAVPEQLF
jgi:8-oxo-dGTP diphosphatase